ncbi:MAG: hypothetical protein U1B80_03925, partial [Anaerolineaceae bacterium]|nr:hypothetical protein [Anaerolineaceae bacterium]
LLESALRLDDSRPEAQQAQDQDSSSSNAETEKREALRKLRLAGIDATMLGVVAEAVTDYETHTALIYVIPGWAVMDTALKLRIIFYSLAVLGYGRVDAEQMNGTSTKVTLRTKFLAEKPSDGASSETGADARYCHGLEDSLQAAFAIATGKGWKAVQVEETQCRAAGFEMCEFQVNVK